MKRKRERRKKLEIHKETPRQGNNDPTNEDPKKQPNTNDLNEKGKKKEVKNSGAPHTKDK